MAVEWFANAVGATAEAVVEYFADKRRRLARPRNIFRLALLVVGIACAVAFGQATPPPATPSPIGGYTFSSPDAITAAISSAVQTQLSALASNSALTSLGDYLCAFFLVALMVWTSVKTMAGGRGFGELLGEWVPIFVAYGIAQLFLNQNAASAIVSMMDSIAGTIGGGNMSTLDGAIRTCAQPIFKAIAAVVSQPRVMSGTSSDGILAAIAAGAASMIMSAIAKVVTGLILVMAGVVMVANVIMGFISVQLVLLLAPLMVPFLMFRPLSWLFDSWLKFLLGACMLKIVVAFLLLVVGALMSTTSTLATQFFNEAKAASATEALTADILLLGMMLVFALLSMLLLMQSPGIATGILSGGAGSIGFGGIKGMTQSAAGRIVAQAPRGTVKLTAEGVRAGTAGFKAGVVQPVRGYLHGKNIQAANPGNAEGVAAKAYNAAYNYAAKRTQGPPTPKDAAYFKRR
jgi:hypothetical protein